MRKRVSSSWVLGWVAVGVVGFACTVQTTDDKDDDDDTGGSHSTGGRSSGGASTAEGGNGEAGEATSGGRTATGGASSGGRTSTGGTTAAEGGAGGSGPVVPVEGLFDCDARSVTGATLVSEDVRGDTTWSGTINIRRNLLVRDGATLTIEPGTHIIMGPDAGIDLGWNTSAATLKATGTADAPIRFCGEQGDPGFWRGIIVEANVTSNSQLSHALISDAGSDSAALTLMSNIEISDVHVRNSEKNGVEAEDFSEGSARLSVEGAHGIAVVATHANAINNFPLGGTFANNAQNFVAVDFSAIDTDATFPEIGIPYHQEGSLQVRKAKVVIDPGVTYLFGADAFLDVGWNSNAATFTAVGTADAPIVFRGDEEQVGYWGGITLGVNVTTNSSLSNVELHHAGGDGRYALEVLAPITLDGVVLTDSEQGAYISGTGVAEDSKNLSITKTGKVALTVEPNALVSLPEGGSFTGNTSDEVRILNNQAFEETGTVPNLGVPYRVMGPIRTYESSITFSPGTKFIMSADSSFEFGWNSHPATVIAVGTAAKPIQFVGADAQPSFWLGLSVGARVLSASKFDHVEVSHGDAACLTLQSSIPVTNSSFSQCSYGILRNESDERDYAATNTFEQVPSGNVGNL